MNENGDERMKFPTKKEMAKEFTISTAPQRTPVWYKERCGIPSASGLGFLFDVLKDGRTPTSKARAYLKQLAFERTFGVTYGQVQTKAMADGVFFEDFAKIIYTKKTGNTLTEAFSYISDWFVATPDANVLEGKKKGLLECKVVGDETFMKLMEEGVPITHELQMQGQMMASGLDWVDYIVINLKTEAYFIKRLKRNNVLIKRIYERLHEPLDLPVLNEDGIGRFGSGLLREFLGENQLEEKDLIIKDLPF